MQVTSQATAFVELKTLTEEIISHEVLLKDILDDIPLIQVADMRETFKTVELLHGRMLDYMLESGRQLDEAGNLTEEMKSEITAAFYSVFPQESCLFWMDLPDTEKQRQVIEMASVIQGIRIYNKHLARGGVGFELPFDLYKLENKALSEKVLHSLQVLNEKTHVCAQAITLHLKSLGMQHVLIQRLRDELNYHLQAFALLEDLQCFVDERFAAVIDLMDQSTDNLNYICEAIGSRPCIGTELVFPRFEALGRLYKEVLAQLKLLRAHERSAVPLLALAMEPQFVCTPTGIANLCAKTGNARSYYSNWRNSPVGLAKLNVLIMYTNFLPKDLYIVPWDENDSLFKAGVSDKNPGNVLKGDKVDEAFEHGVEIQFAGYCPVTLSKFRGLLLHGDPDVGLVVFEEKFYAFYNEDNLKEFAKSPALYLKGVENVVRKMPQLVHLLRLQKDPTFSSLSITEFIDLLNEPFLCEFSTQTSTHIIPAYRWTDETLLKRALELQTKLTDSTQTDCSYFRRSSTTQVWPPKEKWTQTRLNKGTKMTRHVVHLHGLQGPPTLQFKTLRSKYEF